MVYRIWASARMPQLILNMSRVQPWGERSSVEAWYTTAIEIEESISGAIEAHVRLFGADVIKGFDTVDRGILDGVLASLGLTASFRHVTLNIMHMIGCGSSWLRDLVNFGREREGFRSDARLV